MSWIERFPHLEVTFTQASPASVWTFTHNFGHPAIVDVFITNANGYLEKVIPLSISNVDDNTVSIVFSSPQTGCASIS